MAAPGDGVAGVEYGQAEAGRRGDRRRERVGRHDQRPDLWNIITQILDFCRQWTNS